MSIIYQKTASDSPKHTTHCISLSARLLYAKAWTENARLENAGNGMCGKPNDVHHMQKLVFYKKRVISVLDDDRK